MGTLKTALATALFFTVSSAMAAPEVLTVELSGSTTVLNSTLKPGSGDRGRIAGGSVQLRVAGHFQDTGDPHLF